MSAVGGFVIGALLGILMSSVKPHEGEKSIARMIAEYTEETALGHAGVYAIL